MVAPIQKGLDAFAAAKPEVRILILEHARARVDSSQAGLSSLTTRLSALTGLLFAGAAVATNIAVDSQKVTELPAWLAASAACLFVVAGGFGITGLWSGRSIFAGEPPSWWVGQGVDLIKGLDANSASFWIAGHLESVIASTAKVSRRRALSLNIALVVGAAAGLLVAASAVVSVHGRAKTAVVPPPLAAAAGTVPPAPLPAPPATTTPAATAGRPKG